MKYIKSLLIIVITFSIVGCSSPGPMETSHGLIGTNAFDPLFIKSIIADQDEEVLFKAITVFSDKEKIQFAVIYDTLVISESGVYLTEWNTEHHRFRIKMKLPFNDIKDAHTGFQEKMLFGSQQYLEITDNSNINYRFHIFNEPASYALRLIKNRI